MLYWTDTHSVQNITRQTIDCKIPDKVLQIISVVKNPMRFKVHCTMFPKSKAKNSESYYLYPLHTMLCLTLYSSNRK